MTELLSEQACQDRFKVFEKRQTTMAGVDNTGNTSLYLLITS
jgi:hypothetical protein